MPSQLGTIPADAKGAVQEARLICRGLLIATFAVAGWAWVYPFPFWLPMIALAIIPWVAIAVVARYPALVVINQNRRDRRPTVGLSFLLPGLFLAARVMSDMNLLNWKRALLTAAVMSAALSATAVRVDPLLCKQKLALLLLFGLGLAYGYGTTAIFNGLLDRSAVQVYSARITRKYVSGSKSINYHLKLTAWGPRQSGDDVLVPFPFYQTMQVGDEVCLGLRQGAFGIPWYQVGACR